MLTDFTAFLKLRRRELDAWLSQRGIGHTFSLASYGLYRSAAQLVTEHARGVVLDAGSGHAPYRQMLRERGQQVISIDIEDRSGDVTHIADIQNMPVIATGSIDTVICTEVLEHVPAPWDALKELERVLKPGGTLILTVPYLAPIHEAPNDFFRYTRYALELLLTRAGFQLEQLEEVGGAFAFLGHGASMAFFGSCGALPGLRELAWGINYALLVRGLGLVDSAIGLKHVYPCNYVLLARKPGAS
ncbi:MAG: class I SAM-dependent methyltransferase [Polyangiaceae bacterium]